MAGTAGQGKGAVHQLDELAANGQPQAGAAEPAGGGGVRLVEGLKQFFLVFLRNPNAGVANGKGQPDVIAGFIQLRDFQGDFALFGEFDGVAQQVQQNLPQPRRVADQLRLDVGRDRTFQGDSLGLRPRSEQFNGMFHGLAQIEGHFFKSHLARLDF